jgi:hypothetical protein
VLLSGLITIPFWGYMTMPIAYMEIMLSDLPHVQYHPKQKFSKEYTDAVVTVQQDMQKKIKEKGLRGIKNLNLNFDNVIDGNALLQNLK